METTISTPNEIIEDGEIEGIISSLPKVKGWFLNSLYNYQGFWFSEGYLKGVLAAQKIFNAKPSNAILATYPKSGTTWLSALLFTTINRARFDYATHPLLASNPHDCVPFIEHLSVKNPASLSDLSLLASHTPFQLLAHSARSSAGCPIVYVCRDPKDVFVSDWHFMNDLRPEGVPPIDIEHAFELQCQGVSAFGPHWDLVLGYWKASQEMPNKLFFVRYEQMKDNPVGLLKKLACFIGHPFSPEEEREGVVEKIVEFCSFKSLSQLEVNKGQGDGKKEVLLGTKVANKMFFRKGEIGDHKNYLTDDMILRLNEITRTKFSNSGLE